MFHVERPWIFFPPISVLGGHTFHVEHKDFHIDPP